MNHRIDSFIGGFEMKSILKRITALLLCVVMCVSLLPVSAFAEGEEDEGESIASTPEPTKEPTPAPEPDPTTAPVPDPTEPPAAFEPSETEDTPDDAPTPTPTNLSASAPTPVTIIFRISPDGVDATVLVYTKDEKDRITEIEPESDGSYELMPGLYFYTVTAKGYEDIPEEELEVEPSDKPVKIRVSLNEKKELVESISEPANTSKPEPNGTEPDQPHEHEYVPAVTDPTCTEQGYTIWTCECGASYVDGYTDALGHTPKDVDEIPAEVGKPGTAAGTVCSVCDEVLEGCEPIPALEEETIITIFEQPKDAEPVDGVVTFTVTATVNTDIEIRYQWQRLDESVAYKDDEEREAAWEDIKNETKAVLKLEDLDNEDILAELMKYAYRCLLLANETISSTEEVHVKPIEKLREPEQTKSTIASGNCGVNLIWELDDEGTLTISGSGSMDTYSMGTAPWYSEYRSAIKNIIINTDVNTIGKYAFYGCDCLANVTISYGVTNIDCYAFQNCSNLTRVNIPNSVTNIGDAAFYGCSSLTSVMISNNVTSVKGSTFYGCSSMTSATIPNSVTGIAESAFCGCNTLTDVYYSGTVSQWNSIQIDNNNDPLVFATKHYEYAGSWIDAVAAGEIGDNLFWQLGSQGDLHIRGAGAMPDYSSESPAPWSYYSSYIEGIVIEEGVTTIGDSAFAGCSNMTEAAISDSVASVGNYAFSGCSSLRVAHYSGTESQWNSIQIGNNNDPLVYAEKTYEGSENQLIAEGTCGENLFWELFQSGEFDIFGTGLMTDYSAENPAPWSIYSSQIGWVVINEEVTTIGDYAFAGCNSMEEVAIPESVTSVGSYAFSGCSSLRVVHYSGTESQWNSIQIGNNNDPLIYAEKTYVWGTCGEDLFWTLGSEGGLLIMGTGPMTDYSAENPAPWSIYISQIGWINIEEGVTTIGENAFTDCSSMTEVRIPDSVTSVGNYAFSGCDGLTVVLYSGTVSQWNSIQIGNNNDPLVYAEKTYEWSNDPIAEGTCGDNLFWQLYSEGSLFLRGTGPMTDYSSESPSPWSMYSSQIGWIVIEEGVTTVGDYAFAGCSSMTEAVIPDSVTSVGNYAFSGCNSLQVAHYSGTVSQWNSIQIGNNNNPLVFVIKDYEGSGINAVAAGTCGENLTWVLDNDGVLTISGTGAMFDYGTGGPNGEDYGVPWESYRSSIVRVIIESGVTHIGCHAFGGCGNLASITVPASVTSVSDWAFNSCYSIRTAGPVGSGCDYEFGWTTFIPGYAFSGLVELNSVVIPNGVTSIGYEAFSGCGSLASITIPSSVINIGGEAFEGCDSLRDITFRHGKDDTLTIGDDAFLKPDYADTIFTRIYVPDAADINDAFSSYDWEGDGRIVAYFGESFTIYNSGMCGYNAAWVLDRNGVLTISGTGAMDDYGTGGPDGSYYGVPWEDYTDIISCVIIESGVTHIGCHAFDGCGNLASITVPASVTSVKDWAFNACGGIKTAGPIGSDCDYQFGWTTFIPEYAFSGLTELNNAVIPEGISSIGYESFSGCCSLKCIVIPSSVTSISEKAFDGCDCLEDITFRHRKSDLLTIDDGAFRLGGMGRVFTRVYVPDAADINSTVAFFDWRGNGRIAAFIGDSRIVSDLGICGNEVTWVLYSDGVLMISGTGPMDDYGTGGPDGSYFGVPWESYRNSIIRVIIGDEVTHIGRHAFNGCSNLVSIMVPESVYSVNEWAFNGCTGIKTAGPVGSGCDYQYDYWTSIPGYAFSGLTELESVIIPTDISSIGYESFSGCCSLKSIVIPSSVTYIIEKAFYGCDILEDISFRHRKGDALSIGDAAFKKSGETDPIITNIYVPDAADINNAITSYDWEGDGRIATFLRDFDSGTCGNDVTWVLDDDGVLTISGTGAMYDYGTGGPDGSYFGVPWEAFTDLITRVIIENGVTHLGRHAFDDCINLASITVPASVTSVNDWTFNNCISLKTAGPIGSGCDYQFGWTTSIPGYAISGLTELNNAVIPDGISSIGFEAFSGCGSLVCITIPSSIMNISEKAFDGCSSLSDVYYMGTKQQRSNTVILDGNVMSGSNGNLTSATWHCADGDIHLCGDNVVWTLDVNGVLTISGTGAMYDGSWNEGENGEQPWNWGLGWRSYRDSITRVIIENGVSHIGYQAFEGCINLTSISVPESITSINDEAFINCDNIRTAGPVGSGCDYQFGWMTSIPVYAFLGLTE